LGAVFGYLVKIMLFSGPSPHCTNGILNSYHPADEALWCALLPSFSAFYVHGWRYNSVAELTYPCASVQRVNDPRFFSISTSQLVSCPRQYLPLLATSIVALMAICCGLLENIFLFLDSFRIAATGTGS
jgi:hypothetical protein